MRTLFVIGLMLVLCMAALAQTSPAPTPSATLAESNDGVHFVTDSAFYQLSDGKQATVFTTRVPLTPRYSGVFSQWLVPDAKGAISMGGVEFREKLSHLLGKYAASSSNLDLSKFEVFGRGQAGSELNAVDGTKKFAFGMEGGLEFPVGTIAGGTVKTGVRFGYLGVPGAHERFQLGSNATVSPQVSVSF